MLRRLFRLYRISQMAQLRSISGMRFNGQQKQPVPEHPVDIKPHPEGESALSEIYYFPSRHQENMTPPATSNKNTSPGNNDVCRTPVTTYAPFR